MKEFSFMEWSWLLLFLIPVAYGVIAFYRLAIKNVKDFLQEFLVDLKSQNREVYDKISQSKMVCELSNNKSMIIFYINGRKVKLLLEADYNHSFRIVEIIIKKKKVKNNYTTRGLSNLEIAELIIKNTDSEIGKILRDNWYE